MKQNLMAHVEYLSTIPNGRGHTNTKGMGMAINYIIAHMPDTFKLTRQPVLFKETIYENLVFTLQGKSEEKVVITAHYDSYGSLPGACDNATGVACLIELAKAVSEHNLTAEIVFIALEEPPAFGAGSQVHAQSLKGQNIKVCINVDMIGWFSDLAGSQKSSHGDIPMPDVADFLCAFKHNWPDSESESVCKGFENCNINFLPLTYDYFGGALGSDSRSYHSCGYDTVLFNDTAFLRSEHYHKKTDILENVDIDRMTESAKGIIAYVTSLLA